jgi:methionine-rich copper-binding protein CopC
MIVVRALAMAVLMSAGAAGYTPAPAWHTHLVRSEPAVNDTLARSPSAIRLWFSEPVELAVTTVKLADAAGTSVALAKVTRADAGEAAPVAVTLNAPLPPGSYVITWRTAAKDGHPANGTINFVVKEAPR